MFFYGEGDYTDEEHDEEKTYHYKLVDIPKPRTNGREYISSFTGKLVRYYIGFIYLSEDRHKHMELYKDGHKLPHIKGNNAENDVRWTILRKLAGKLKEHHIFFIIPGLGTL